MTEFKLNRRQLMKTLGAGGLAMSAGNLLAVGAAISQEGRTLRIRNDGDIRRLDPATRGGWYDETIMFAIYAGLVRYTSGDEWGWQLDAAESIDDSDPLNIAFTLRPGIMFTNDFGELTAEDVKFSYERFLDPAVNAVYGSDWVALDSVEVTDTYSGIIHLKQPFAPLLTSTMPHASGLIVSKAAMEASGSPNIETDPLACSGPYQIGEWRPREIIRLVRNPGWTGPEPYYDTIEILPIDDLTAAETAFDAGDLDVTQIAVNSIVTRDPEADNLVVKPALAYTWLGMNVENEKLQDVRVRRAIQQAINPAEVVLATFGEAVTPAYGVVPPPLLGARESNIYGYDPEAAQALLAGAGAEGLSVTLSFGGDPDLLIAAQVIQAHLAAAGISLEIRSMDGATLTAQQQDNEGGTYKEIELFFSTFTTAPDPSWVTEWFTCSQVGVWNFQRTCSEEWDAQNAAAAEETDEAARAEMYIDLQNQLEETGAYVFLYHGVNAWVSAPDVDPAYSADAQWALLRDFTGTE
ncbi:ABC transporter substrate-binding protein [Pelagovum pacificum]|uniref:Twin-arginine translocation signal domain-containing protein n=1 Tax=Pelagovum pacificum TaxID=2588711 RepID=A0A5C5G8H9_9RHOB|nr:ABC transporter substrate-binding protein [Pelagovum pacificum]QQA41731.1 twin-arginine translocation signal domain-containing protein [Pelagovum pacificum]TNY31006.1 twin-arginine translocation signal domain-containing protein [Pelagovum pacificum]